MKQWIKDRLKEKSSWVAIFGTIASITGYTVSSQYQELIIGLSIALIGGTAFGTKADKK